MRRTANAWDLFYRHQAAPWRGQRPVADLVPLVGPGPVLELGCGNGKLLLPLQAAGVDAVGLDVSWHALARLGQGVLADAAILPFADAAFGAVLDVHCTGHLLAGGRRAAAAEKARVLAPGGHLVVERLAPDDLRALKGSTPEPGTRQLADGRTTHFSGAQEIAAEHRPLGVVAIEPVRRETRHRGVDVTRSSVRVVMRKRE